MGMPQSAFPGREHYSVNNLQSSQNQKSSQRSHPTQNYDLSYPYNTPSQSYETEQQYNPPTQTYIKYPPNKGPHQNNEETNPYDKPSQNFDQEYLNHSRPPYNPPPKIATLPQANVHDYYLTSDLHSNSEDGNDYTMKQPRPPTRQPPYTYTPFPPNQVPEKRPSYNNHPKPTYTQKENHYLEFDLPPSAPSYPMLY